MRNTSKKIILNACKLSFDGKTDPEVAAALGKHVSAISRWRKTAMWQEFEQELITTHKQSLLEDAHPKEALSEG